MTQSELTQTTAIQKPADKAIAAPSPSREALGTMWRHAQMLSESDLVPAAYKSKPANCVIAIELAARLGSSPLQIMQSLDIIQGKPSWSSKFLIATVNASGRFTPLRYEFEGKQGTQDWGCRAVATDLGSKEVLRGPLVSMAMAKDEGWLTKSGSKWKTMPELMIMYRSAAFWTRVYAPEMSMGLHTSEEREDIVNVPSVRNNMPDDIKTALLSEGVTVVVPDVAAAEAKPKPEPTDPEDFDRG